jgi:hypothetical protein
MKLAETALEEDCVIIRVAFAVAFMVTMVPNANIRLSWVRPIFFYFFSVSIVVFFGVKGG